MSSHATDLVYAKSSIMGGGITVLKVYNDLLMAADSGLVSALCLLDPTATFDTVVVRSTWCHTAVVQILPERQTLLCLVRRRCLEDRVRRLLGSSGLSPQPATV